MLGVEVFLNFIFFLALDNKGRGSVKLRLQRQGITGVRLQKFDGEHWVDFHRRREVKLISLGSDAFEGLEGAF